MGTNELNFIESQQKMFTLSALVQSRLPREIVAFTCEILTKIDIVLGKLLPLTLLWGGRAWTT